MIKSLYCIIFICLNIASCGYHLKGSHSNSSMKNIKIINLQATSEIKHSLFYTLVKQELQDKYNIQVVEEYNSNYNVLKLLHEEVTRNVLSVNASSVVNQYQLTYNLTILFNNEKHDIKISNSYDVDPNNLLNDYSESDMLKNKMRLAAIDKLITIISLSKQ